MIIKILYNNEAQRVFASKNLSTTINTMNKISDVTDMIPGSTIASTYKCANQNGSRICDSNQQGSRICDSSQQGSKVFSNRLWNFEIIQDRLYDWIYDFKMWNRNKLLDFSFMNMPPNRLESEKISQNLLIS